MLVARFARSRRHDEGSALAISHSNFRNLRGVSVLRACQEWGHECLGWKTTAGRNKNTEHADELFKIAEQTAEGEEREQLLRMAEAWLKLAAKMKELGGET